MSEIQSDDKLVEAHSDHPTAEQKATLLELLLNATIISRGNRGGGEVEILTATTEQARRLHDLLYDLANRQPDHLYDANDWEYTMPWQDRHDMAIDLSVGEMKRFCTLLDGPDKWAAKVATSLDEEGDPIEWELRWFDSEEAAQADIDFLRDIFESTKAAATG